ncbi:hypothetical protein CHS0354_020718 [Potamilus streckersoni]|uniref:Uncharacterized protein n=1 Tax=Potamilus streckersoni TaxID=2493646 RepID=A0AAE0S7J1_9BIVA|nr:hypothetical protein CHS0354_020718 [Potamilus streckersoni]
MSETFICLLLIIFMIIEEPITMATGYRILRANYTENFEIFCTEPDFFLSVTSTYSSEHKDRKWDFTCGSSSQISVSSKRSRCYWHGFSGIYDQPFKLECLKNGFMQGIGSIYSNHHKDRMWDYYCCFKDEYSVKNCYTTDQLNKYSEPLKYNIPDGYVLRGFNSSHHNIYEDRIYWFEFCKLITATSE